VQYKFSVPAFRGDELGKEKKKEEEKTTEKEKNDFTRVLG